MTAIKQPTDRVIYRQELYTMLNGICANTMRRWIKSGKLPKPDVALTRRTMGWKLSTLHRAGIKI